MRAAIFRDGQIRVDTVPDPVPEQGQVLVETLRRGIRGSDPHAKVMVDPWLSPGQ